MSRIHDSRLIGPEVKRALLRDGQLLQIHQLDAKWGQEGLWSPAPCPKGTQEEDAQARARDALQLNADRAAGLEALLRLDQVDDADLLPIDSPAALACLIRTMLPMLRDVQAWERSREADLFFAAWGAPPIDGALGAYDPSDLIQHVGWILLDLAGTEKPVMPRGRPSIDEAINVLQEVVGWCEREEPQVGRNNSGAGTQQEGDDSGGVAGPNAAAGGSSTDRKAGDGDSSSPGVLRQEEINVHALRPAKTKRRSWPGLGDFLLKRMALIKAGGQKVNWMTIAKDYGWEHGLNPVPSVKTCRGTYFRAKQRQAASGDVHRGKEPAR